SALSIFTTSDFHETYAAAVPRSQYVADSDVVASPERTPFLSIRSKSRSHTPRAFMLCLAVGTIRHPFFGHSMYTVSAAFLGDSGTFSPFTTCCVSYRSRPKCPSKYSPQCGQGQYQRRRSPWL